jgi:hypothetical protein
MIDQKSRTGCGHAGLIFTVILVGSALFVIPKCHGFDWPVEEKILMATFGERRHGHFFSGIDWGGGEQIVFPVADGEVIFIHEEGGLTHALKRGNGSFVVLQHEGGIRSSYSHLKNRSIPRGTKFFQAKPRQIARDVFQKSIIGKLTEEIEITAVQNSYSVDGDHFTLREDLSVSDRALLWKTLVKIGFVNPLGQSGDSGMSTGLHLSLMIIDHEERTILNPIKKDKSPLQPILEVEEGAGPVIDRVYLLRDTDLLELKNNLSVAPGEGEVLARIYDKSDYVSFNRNMAPYRLYLGDSGKVVSTVTFNSLEEKEGRLVITNTNINCDDLYYEDWFYRLGHLTFVEGKSQIQIRAEDFSGRESSMDISLWVTAD